MLPMQRHYYGLSNRYPAQGEPIKLWLAKVGYDACRKWPTHQGRWTEPEKPGKSTGYSEKWIQQRMMGQETRNKLTDYWKEHEIKEGLELPFSQLFMKSGRESASKNIKLSKAKIPKPARHMSEAELIFTALAELSTRQLLKVARQQVWRKQSSGKKGGEDCQKSAARIGRTKRVKKWLQKRIFCRPQKAIKR